MIGKLQKKLLLVLMIVMCVFLAGILASMFISIQNDYEHRSMNAMNAPRSRDARPSADETSAEDLPNPGSAPIAFVHVDADGTIAVRRNQIYYITEDELVQVVAELEKSGEDTGTASEYEMRYMRHADDNGVNYFFSDTTIERNSLKSQLIISSIVGLGAIVLFFVVSLLLSRWMVKPVQRVWEKQRQFIADASHELKTPLTVILSNTDMLIASHAVTDDKNSRRLDNIRAESQRMKGLVESLLTLAHSDNQSDQLPREPVNLSYVVTSATLTMESAIFDMGRTLECDVQDGLMVLGDAAKLRQLVDVLLDNACKYGDPDSSIEVKLEASGKKEVCLTVASHGEPLTPEECVSIFERFYRLDKSRGKEKGYGLGLSIAYNIAKQHGGRIEAQSDGARSNLFIVHLPCAEGAALQSVGATPAQ